MKKIIKSCLLLLTFLGVFALGQAYAQIPNNLGNVKASQISDGQLMQFIQQAQNSGLSEEQLIQEFKRRGLPESELDILASRIQLLTGVNIAGGNDQNGSEDGKNTGTGVRRYKGDGKLFRPSMSSSRVFGADLFTSADPLFVPNLKIATPKGYVLGTEDELQLDVFGNNIFNQKLVVSPEGFIKVKYVGLVNVNGMTIEQATGVIKARLSKFYPALVTGETKLQLSLGSVRSIQVTMVGAVKNPGTITIPSISTLYNALYTSGGPLDNGSFRNIELIRDNKVIVYADLYDFILKGDQSANLSLRDNDIIRVPYARTQVAIEGAVNRVGIFEVKPTETVQNVIDFAGGFRGNAYKGRIIGTRFTDTEKSIVDIVKENYSSHVLMNGDSLFVNQVMDRFDNRVFISGAVFNPGAYSLEPNMDLKALIVKAQGLKEEAFTEVANMVRLKDDYTKEYLTLNLKDVLSGKSVVKLKKEDSLHVESVLDLKDFTTVKINGPVRSPGRYRYEDSLSLKGLILKAGGLLDNATTLKIEVGRRRTEVAFDTKGAPTSEIISIDIDRNLTNNGNEIILRPFDVVSIKQDPAKVKQVAVEVKGQIVFAGTYTLENPEEKLSSIIKRAGGILPYADIYGAKLIRKRVIQDTASIKRLSLSNSTANDKLRSDSMMLIEMDQLNSTTTEVALELEKIIAYPGSEEDLTLQDGDQIIIPKFVNTVSISGEVLKPVTVQFEPGLSFSSYISAAGGFNRSAFKKRVFVVYSNGRSASTKSFLGIKSYPKIKPGSSIFVPLAPARQNGFDSAKAGVLVSAFASVMTTLVLLFR